MKQPWWRRWWSYFTEVHIESTSSNVNDNLLVRLSKGEYQLCTSEAIYSYGNLYDNFYKTFEKIHLPQNGSKVLVLGLGLASVVWMLERKFRKNYDYVAVELDDEVIYLASKYVLDEIKSEMQIINTDALHFVHAHDDQYDMVIVDIFLSDYIPRSFETESFLMDVKRCLKPGGIVLLNRLYLYEKDRSKTESYFNHTFKKIFAKADKIHVAGNWILLSDGDYIK